MFEISEIADSTISDDVVKFMALTQTPISQRLTSSGREKVKISLRFRYSFVMSLVDIYI